MQLIEVKSLSSQKEEHLADAAVQVHVLERSAIRVTGVDIMHLNKECHFPDLWNLLERTEVTAAVQPLLGKAGWEIDAQLAMLDGLLPLHCALGNRSASPPSDPTLNRMSSEFTICLYGGSPGEIGGNRILLEWPEHRWLLDFGTASARPASSSKSSSNAVAQRSACAITCAWASSRHWTASIAPTYALTIDGFRSVRQAA